MSCCVKVVQPMRNNTGSEAFSSTKVRSGKTLPAPSCFDEAPHGVRGRAYAIRREVRFTRKLQHFHVTNARCTTRKCQISPSHKPGTVEIVRLPRKTPPVQIVRRLG